MASHPYDDGQRQLKWLQQELAQVTAERDQLKQINAGLCTDHNHLLADGARWQERAEQVEAALTAIRSLPRYNCDCLNADKDGAPTDDNGVYCQRWIVLADDLAAALARLRPPKEGQ